jgi:uncharacterized membrane protein
MGSRKMNDTPSRIDAGSSGNNLEKPTISWIVISIIILLILLIIINIIVFEWYKSAHPDDSLADQRWAYLNTDVFQTITVSLVLPIILLLLESHFKIIHNINENRDKLVAEREKEGRETERKAREEQKEKRWKCIDETAAMWSELMSSTSDVIYFGNGKDDPDDQKEGTGIEETMKRLINVMVTYKTLVTAWYIRFPKLESDIPYFMQKDFSVAHLFHSFIIMLFNSAYTVAEHIRTDYDPEETKTLQYALEIIQERIDETLHYPMLLILKDAAQLEDTEHSSDKRMRIIRRLIEEQENLDHWAKVYLKKSNHNMLLPTLPDNTEKASAFRKLAKQLEDQLRECQKDDLDDYDAYLPLQQSFLTIDPEDIINDYRTRYTPDYLKELAREMAFDLTYKKIEENANWCPGG